MIRGAMVGGLALALSGCLAFHPDRLPGHPAGATFLEIGDTQVHYVDRGQRTGQPPLVLLHGFGASTDAWSEIRKPLESERRVIAIDLKGHGWTTRPEGDYSIAAQADLVLKVLSGLNVDRFVVAGHSWGSAVAVAIALEAPERVQAVVLLNGMLFDDQQPTLFYWARAPGLGELIFAAFYTERLEEKIELALHDDFTINQKVVDGLEERWSRPGARAAALATVRGIDLEALEARYADVKQPVLVLWGREDRVTPLQWGEELLKRLPRARLRVLPRCGHNPNIEAWRPVVRHIREFLGGVL